MSKNEKRIIYGAVIITGLLIVIATSWLLLKKKIGAEEIRYCLTANDCVPVGCSCHCSGCGGFSYEAIVNEKFANLWYTQHKCKPSAMCTENCCVPKIIQCKNNQCLAVDKGATITTDEREYYPGQNIVITIKNNTEEAITIIAPWEFIEKFESNEWKKVGIVWQCPCGLVCESPGNQILEPGQEKTAVWNQRIGNTCNNQLPDGHTFRIGVKIKLHTEEQTIYSNKFSIGLKPII